MPTCQPTTIIWRRFGREHGEQTFCLNDAATVHSHLVAEVEQARQTPENQWRWYQINDRFLVERLTSPQGQTTGLLSYLPQHNWLIEDRWDEAGRSVEWCIHLGSTLCDEALSSWVFTDWFVDVLWNPSSNRYRVEDLDDLALVHQLGIIDDVLLHHIMHSTQLLLAALEHSFPPMELTKMNAVMRQLGWL